MFQDTHTQKIDPDPYQGGAAGVVIPSFTKAQDFHVVTLGYDDIPAFVSLQKIVRDKLDADKKHHLKERTPEDLKTHLDAGMPLIGVKDGKDVLVGQVLTSFADSAAAKNITDYPFQGKEKTTLIIQSFAVHPDYEGLGLSKKMHAKIIAVAAENGRTELMAKVADDNPKSQKSFEKNLFNAAAKGTDPVKGYDVTYFAKTLNGCSAAQPKVAMQPKIA
ncbi:MAG: hypothetical protein DI626_06595 [Micavibrio aeruginosavorus]|uniref:N-acetyltransferase domain-containing protein n=1 Tax=Micavibrio aeruginosavorus TaxID=349221 RepID=A0A2W5BTB3_9BACT|nr:MAG: hypothetical protein DI626_06595 [Micavibrio aeruginosavorus]